MSNIQKIYKILLEAYGPQGWWPILSHKGTNPTKAGSINGYHVGDYSFPKNRDQQFEICMGAILTQNTSWPSVETALTNLKRSKALKLKEFRKLSDGKLRELIKPAGYYNQKANYLKNFTEFFMTLRPGQLPSRSDILSVKGVGDETADSILLFAFMQPEFIVDAYTKRIFSRVGIIKKEAKKDATYHQVKEFFQSNLEPDIRIYQEYHALIVEHAKRHCRTRPDCQGCQISEYCQKKHL
jgi:endonuclease-3 related protein